MLVLNYNLKKKNTKEVQSSFIVAQKKKKFTEGCIAIKKENLELITKSLTPLTKFIIS